MSPEVSDLLKRALALSDESVQEAWDQEVERRIEDLRAGKAVTVAWEELHRELLAMVNEL